MVLRTGILDQSERNRQKEASRERDRMRLEAGEISRPELRAKNGFFSSLGLRDFRIVSVGGRPLAKAR